MANIQKWDAIIVGTGMGGGAAGYLLSQAGLKVLFLEAGSSKSMWSNEFSKDYPEHFIFKNKVDRVETFKKSGRATFSVNDWIPVMGEGIGGSSALYGGVLLPFAKKDFEQWPFTFFDLKPYYDMVDHYFRPKGHQDPLASETRNLIPPRNLSKSQLEIYEYFKSRGLHPFQIPVAFQDQTNCKECFGVFCLNNCKNTSENVFVTKAIEEFQAQIKYQMVVQSLSLREDHCYELVALNSKGESIKLNANYFFLAGGALQTPIILRNSKSEKFPKGLGNHSDHLGRHLMRHFIDFYFVKTKSKEGVGSKLIELSLTDFQKKSDLLNFIINSSGGLMRPSLMIEELLERLKKKNLLIKILKPIIKPFMNFWAQSNLDQRILVSSILEDIGEFENKILPNSTHEKVNIQYNISKQEKEKIQKCREHLKTLFSPLDHILLKIAEDSSFLAHVCGTCRMGNDPALSVVDPKGKVHGCQNVYVVDNSVFPTSGAANPSMTTAAVALKIATEFISTWQKKT